MNRGQLLDTLRGIVAEIKEEPSLSDEVTEDWYLFDLEEQDGRTLALDSLDVLDVVTLIEEKTGKTVDVQEDLFTRVRTVGDALSLFSQDASDEAS